MVKMLIPTVPAKEFKKFGFKKCAGEYGKSECYYLCISRGIKMIFVSNEYFDVNNWKDGDPRFIKNQIANTEIKEHILILFMN